MPKFIQNLDKQKPKKAGNTGFPAFNAVFIREFLQLYSKKQGAVETAPCFLKLFP